MRGNPNYDEEDVRSTLYEYGATYFPSTIPKFDRIPRLKVRVVLSDGAQELHVERSM